MMLYQKIPTTSARIHPLMAGAAIAVIVFSAVATVAIVRWLPEAGRPAAAVAADIGADVEAPALPAGYATVSSPVPATAARASSASVPPPEPQAAPRKAQQSAF